MPLSIWRGLEDCLEAIVERRPESVLDAGIGFGLFGHLLRQYLDVWEGRIERSQWRVLIDGIEIDERRIQPHARYLYDHIYVGDIRALVPQHGVQTRYDVILFGDVLEHLPKAHALVLLRQSIALAAKLVAVRIPLGEGWRKEGREAPDHHRSTWSLNDFSGLASTIYQYDYYGNPYALVAIDAGITRRLSTESADRRLLDVEARLRHLFSSRETA
jgi:hypothetical protein